jgi:hypothetical protein
MLKNLKLSPFCVTVLRGHPFLFLKIGRDGAPSPSAPTPRPFSLKKRIAPACPLNAFGNFLLTLLFDKQHFGIFLKGNAH